MSTPDSAAGRAAAPRRAGLTVALFALKVAASVGLLWLATRGIDFASAFAAVDRVEPLLLVAAPLAVMTAAAVNAVRWRGLMAAHGAPLGLRRARALLFVTQFFNSGLPSTLGGDAARIVYAVRGGAAAANVIAATILDRFAGYSSVILYAAAVVLLQPFGLEFPAVWRAILIVLALVVPAGVVVLAVINLLPRPDVWAHLAVDPDARGLQARAARLLFLFLRVRIDVPAVLAAIVVSVPIVILIGVALFLLNTATCGCADLDLPRAIAIAGPLVLSVSVPISMAGWGVREVVMVGLYGLMGLPPEQGLVTSVLYGLTVFVAGLPGLFVWLALRAPERARTG